MTCTTHHLLDNQGLCHWCGLLLEPYWWPIAESPPYPMTIDIGAATEKANDELLKAADLIRQFKSLGYPCGHGRFNSSIDFSIATARILLRLAQQHPRWKRPDAKHEQLEIDDGPEDRVAARPS